MVLVLFLFPDVVHKAVCHYHSLGNVVAYVVVAYHAADSGIYGAVRTDSFTPDRTT